MAPICKLRVGEDKYFAPPHGLTIASVIALALLLALGIWQIERMAWKEKLLREVSAAMSADPTPLPTDIPKPKALDYRHFKISGRFENDQEIYLGGRPRPGQVGFDVLTPFRLDDGRLLMVNRGWVPLERLASAARIKAQITGETTLSGIVRVPKEANWLTPPPDPTHRIFYSYDILGFSSVLNERVLPFVLEADENTTLPGGPEAGVLLVNLPNNHLMYAVTWFSLALALAVIWALCSLRTAADIEKEISDDDDTDEPE